MVNKPVYLAASLLAILSVIAIGASTNNNVFAQSDEVQATIVPGASTLTDTAYSPNPIQAKVGQDADGFVVVTQPIRIHAWLCREHKCFVKIEG